MGTWLDRNRGWVFGLITVIALATAAVFIWQSPSQAPIEIVPPPTATSTPIVATPTPSLLRVYVTGAVINSDVYYLKPGSIVKDAIIAAGGLAPNAVEEGINQATELKDQQHIHVPAEGETNSFPPIQDGIDPKSPALNQPGDSVRLNSATVADLEQLPGIGPVLALRILEYRESVGGFTAKEQLKEVDGIGEATFRNIEPLVTVD
jgi:competence protein ComEA